MGCEAVLLFQQKPTEKAKIHNVSDPASLHDGKG